MRPESEVRYQSLLQSVPDALIAVDLNGRITEVNGAMERLTGREARISRGFSSPRSAPARVWRPLSRKAPSGS